MQIKVIGVGNCIMFFGLTAPHLKLQDIHHLHYFIV
jgi:hypothetical protein